MNDRGQVIAVGGPPTFRQQVARALGLEPDQVEWAPTVAAVEESLIGRPSSPNVVVLSPAIKEIDAFGLADYVGRSSPVTAVVLVRDRTLNGTLPAAMRAGVRDVVDMSKGGEELREALDRAVTWSHNVRSARPDGRGDVEQRRGRIFSVFSSKGGTGKTFLATNLAAALARESKQDVAVVDLDVDLGDVFSYFGREPTRPLQDLLTLDDNADGEQVKNFGSRLDEHLWGFGSPHDPGVREIGGEILGQVVRPIRRSFGYVVLDATSDYSDAALSAFDLSEQIFLITGLDVVGVRHLSVALQTLLSLGFPRDRFRIVLNRADSKVGIGATDVERVMRIRVDAMIPSSRLVPLSLNNGVPVVLHEPKSSVAGSIRALAQRIAADTSAPARKRRLFRKD